MRTIKRTIINTVVFALILMALISVFPIFYFESETVKYKAEQEYRASLAGTIDTLFVGASQTYNSIQPLLYDAAFDTNAYILASPNISLQARYDFLKKECSRNPVKTVYLELSFDVMPRTDDALANLYYTDKLDTPAERVLWGIRSFDITEIETILSKTTQGTFEKIWYINSSSIKPDDTIYQKGFKALKPEWIENEKMRNRDDYEPHLSSDARVMNMYYLRKIIKYCKKKEIQLTIISMPLSSLFISHHTGFDGINEMYHTIASKNDIKYYDFSLLKSLSGFKDEMRNYNEPIHMSGEGSTVFTGCFIDIMKKVQSGEDVSALFYDSYAEMISAQ